MRINGRYCDICKTKIDYPRLTQMHQYDRWEIKIKKKTANNNFYPIIWTTEKVDLCESCTLKMLDYIKAQIRSGK